MSRELNAVEQAWGDMAYAEAKSLAELLATNGRCVMVLVIGAASDASLTTYTMHAAAGDTDAHLHQFSVGLQSKLNWLRDKLRRRS